MKEIPILFNTEMVQAVKSGLKTATRRILDKQPDERVTSIVYDSSFDKERPWIAKTSPVDEFNPSEATNIYKSKFGSPGDILWVRETFCEPTLLDGLEQDYYYFADNIPAYGWDSKYIGPNPKWKPSIHMPREAARLFLTITDVRIERLKDISKESAVKEGISPVHQYAAHILNGGKKYVDYMNRKKSLLPIESFYSLWEMVYGSESLKSNPWVWVIEFEIKKS